MGTSLRRTRISQGYTLSEIATHTLSGISTLWLTEHPREHEGNGITLVTEIEVGTSTSPKTLCRFLISQGAEAPPVGSKHVSSNPHQMWSMRVSCLPAHRCHSNRGCSSAEDRPAQVPAAPCCPAPSRIHPPASNKSLDWWCWGRWDHATRQQSSPDP
jgi:hypothetical protein